MPEWWHTLWSYRLDDLLLFSPRAHARLFELVNRETWPTALAVAPVPALLGASLLWRQRGGQALALLLLGLASAAVAELHLRQSLAGLTGVALGWAGAFAAQALAALGLGLMSWRQAIRPHASSDTPSAIGPPRAASRSARALAALLASLALAWPLAAPALGQPLWQAQVFGLAPDPTVLGWLAWAAVAPQHTRVWPVLAAVPLGWAVFAGLMGIAMASPLAPVLPAAGAAVLALRLIESRLARDARRQRSSPVATRTRIPPP